MIGVHNDTKATVEDRNKEQPLFGWKLLILFLVECSAVEVAVGFLVWVLLEEFFDEGNVLIADEIRLSGYAKLGMDIGSSQNSLACNLGSYVGSLDQYLYFLGVGNLKDFPSERVQAVCWWIVLERSPLLMPPTPNCSCFS